MQAWHTWFSSNFASEFITTIFYAIQCACDMTENLPHGIPQGSFDSRGGKSQGRIQVAEKHLPWLNVGTLEAKKVIRARKNRRFFRLKKLLQVSFHKLHQFILFLSFFLFRKTGRFKLFVGRPWLNKKTRHSSGQTRRVGRSPVVYTGDLLIKMTNGHRKSVLTKSNH